MTRTDKEALPANGKNEATRTRVIDAAERLLREGRAEFSMRDLAAAAGVSFATPFNHFGSKAAIMHALSQRRIDTMAELFAAASRPAGAADRVLLAVETASRVMLAEPVVNRAVMGWLGREAAPAGHVWERSAALWILALGDGEGLAADRRAEALACLPGHLAYAFRGVLSFWTAGELADAALAPTAQAIARSLLLGFMPRRL